MSEPVADVATAIAIGSRERQEDAVIANFAGGESSGFAVLSDGMGGHDDGDLASRMIVAEILGAFSLSGRLGPSDQEGLRARLLDAVHAANQSLREQVEVGSGQEGMGGTVITAVVQNDCLSWVSIGDSSLYLFRKGALARLNENHSLGPQIDKLVERGMMDAETARNHPQRGFLTSALVGTRIKSIDCPAEPLALAPGDILLMASDGLEVLGHARIIEILSRRRDRSSQEIACALMEAVASAEDPDQDNVSVIVIKPRIVCADLQAEVPHATQPSRVRTPLRIGIECLRQYLAAPPTNRPVP